jgi:hypothetical protein
MAKIPRPPGIPDNLVPIIAVEQVGPTSYIMHIMCPECGEETGSFSHEHGHQDAPADAPQPGQLCPQCEQKAAAAATRGWAVN